MELWTVYVVCCIDDACFSVEPGYYEVGSFGIRLETLVSVVKANTKVMQHVQV